MAAATSYPSYYDTSPIAPPSDLDSKQVRNNRRLAFRPFPLLTERTS